jgi:hypothetical protein
MKHKIIFTLAGMLSPLTIEVVTDQVLTNAEAKAKAVEWCKQHIEWATAPKVKVTSIVTI